MTASKNTVGGIRTIRRALLSTFYKDGLLDIANQLVALDIEIVSTGGTADFLRENNIPVTEVQTLTGYPSIFGGRVKTLHPAVMGGILYRRGEESDLDEARRFGIEGIDLVIVDLYPFEEYVAKGASDADIIEKIDIGGISLIRAAAKNHEDVYIVSSREGYAPLLEILKSGHGNTTIEQRRAAAAEAFRTSSHYDSAIAAYFAGCKTTAVRYGENPHQSASFTGAANALPEQLWGKEISYNNLLDIEAAFELISDFDSTAVAVIKHNNACGCAVRPTIEEAWEAALAGDPISAFGGIVVTNAKVTKAAAENIGKIFFEVILAPDYESEALEILKAKKNRIILKTAAARLNPTKSRTMFTGTLSQQRDTHKETPEELKPCTELVPSAEQTADLLFANIIVKHSKSNAIVLAKNLQLIGSGVGQTSRVDACEQAIEKAGRFGFDTKGAVMASDAFFPFPDCVEKAWKAGIGAIIQPGGSIRDNESIDFCKEHGIPMVMTGIRHFKH